MGLKFALSFLQQLLIGNSFQGFGPKCVSLAKCVIGNSSAKPWFNALVRGVSKRPGPMACGATGSAEKNASGKGAKIHKHLAQGIAPVPVQMTGISSPSVPLWDVYGAQRQHRGGAVPTTARTTKGDQ